MFDSSIGLGEHGPSQSTTCIGCLHFEAHVITHRRSYDCCMCEMPCIIYQLLGWLITTVPSIKLP